MFSIIRFVRFTSLTYYGAWGANLQHLKVYGAQAKGATFSKITKSTKKFCINQTLVFPSQGEKLNLPAMGAIATASTEYSGCA